MNLRERLQALRENLPEHGSVTLTREALKGFEDGHKQWVPDRTERS